jgi:hypothetical protein
MTAFGHTDYVLKLFMRWSCIVTVMCLLAFFAECAGFVSVSLLMTVSVFLSHGHDCAFIILLIYCPDNHM